ncbi:MAG TPA: penicillin-binding protein [Vicinamibacterales bacterium]|nr:penicillin-binding protein [Vicinamibacterales bacterium]HPW20203.1 penicillin-binding protein [Vicinamibacterales bacterium]
MNEPAGRAWLAAMRARVLVMAACLALWAGAIEARLVHLQVFQRDALEAAAAGQRNRTLAADARRGDIVDRAGRLLATSVDATSICAIPKEIDDPGAVVAAVCATLGDCTAEERRLFAQRLGQKDRAFAFLRRQASIEAAAQVERLGLQGVFMKAEPRRYYPNRELAAHVLGHLGTDNQGLAGIEQSYESRIRGTAGQIIVKVDANKSAFSRVEIPPVPGDTIELTIDAYLQHIAERELERGVAEHRALGGTVIVMAPRTGEILAMANAPAVNPNAYRDYTREAWMNRAVQAIYEPGSTFKIVTASAAMEERTFRPTDAFDVSAGQIRLAGRVVSDTHRYGVLSFTDVIVKSSNVGAIKIGLGVGAERLGRYARRFGFGERLSVDLPGETRGLLLDSAQWNQSGLMSIAMGYQIGVTPLQMAAAVSAVANGGVLLRPRIVRALRRGGVRTGVMPQELRRPISEATASEIVSIMEQVVERGTGTAARVAGYSVAGKTGTASKAVARGYSKTDYQSSFVGFVPSRRPAFTILVVIDSPHAGAIYGGAVAAPVFQRIANAALRYAGVPPTINPLPPVLVKASLEDPPPVELVQASAAAGPPRISVLTAPPTVPDVRGLGAREAARRLSRLGLLVRLTGDGVVIAQDPAAGSVLEPGRVCRAWLGRLSSLPPAPAPAP